MPNRRNVILGLGTGAFVQAPAIVRAATLMPIRPLPRDGWWLLSERYSAGGWLLDRFATHCEGTYERRTPIAVCLPPTIEAAGGSRLTLLHGEYLTGRYRIEPPAALEALGMVSASL